MTRSRVAWPGTGFEAIDLSLLPVAQQLDVTRGAGLIAGAHGSQFVHAQFMPSHSTVIECFSPSHVNPSILQICRVLEHDYHQIVSRSHILQPTPPVATAGSIVSISCFSWTAWIVSVVAWSTRLFSSGVRPTRASCRPSRDVETGPRRQGEAGPGRADPDAACKVRPEKSQVADAIGGNQSRLREGQPPTDGRVVSAGASLHLVQELWKQEFTGLAPVERVEVRCRPEEHSQVVSLEHGRQRAWARRAPRSVNWIDALDEGQ